MRIEVKFFSSFRRFAGKDIEHMEMPEGATVQTLLELLTVEHPDMERALGFVMVAVNRKTVESEHKLKDGDEVSVFPPIAGG